MKLIETEFGRYLYKEICKVYIVVYGGFPVTIPDDIKEELLNDTKKIQK